MSTFPATPINFPDPGKSPVPTKTITRWDTFIGDLASGMLIEAACRKSYITRADIETMLRLDDGGIQKQRYKEARVAGRRSEWTEFELEDLFARIAAGDTVDAACTAVKGQTARELNFWTLINSDPELRTRYREAKEAHAMIIGEDTISLADDKTDDVLLGPKGPMPNMANVTRSKLQVDTRFRYMASYNAKLFGEKKDAPQVNIQINHAERLEEARSRASLRENRVTKQQLKDVVDATFSEKTAEAAAPTEWVDEVPLDTVWREET